MAGAIVGCRLMLFWMATISLVFCVTVTGGRRPLTREDDLEVKRLLKFLNRPGVKSIESDSGIYDCVDIYKQRSLDHPLLKNHTIQMQPTFVPNSNEDGASFDVLPYIGLEGGGCPVGSIPVRRTREEDILRANPISSFGKKPMDSRATHHYAIKRKSGTFFGTRAYLNVWHPRLKHDQQFSLSQIWLYSGEGDDLNTIEVGWTVSPILYHDFETRLFVYWTTDNYKQTGCYNNRCEGFVQTNLEIPLDLNFGRMSHFNETQYSLNVTVYKDKYTGNWWLLLGKIAVGYWPNGLFTRLDGAATGADWGGEVFVQETDFEIDYPDMGSGYYPDQGYKKACYTRGIKILEDYYKDFKHPGDTVTVQDLPRCYQVDSGKYIDKEGGLFFFFGGSCPP